MKPLLCLFGCFLAIIQTAWALSYKTADGNCVYSIAMLAEVYALEHGQLSPTAWSDLQSYLDRPLDEEFRYVLPTKRYAFLAQPLRLPSPPHDELIIVTRRPFRETTLYTNWSGGLSRGYREPGRYLIYRTSEGRFGTQYVLETEVRRIFEGFESLLPTPDTEPERQREVDDRRWLLAKWAAIICLPLILLMCAAYRRWQHAAQR